MPSPHQSYSFDSSGRGQSFLAGLVVLLSIAGVVRAESIIQFSSYTLVLLACVAPSYFWLRAGTPGIPVLPAIGFGCLPYYGWPILGTNEAISVYTSPEILEAALTVCAYLLTATLAWRLVVRRIRSVPVIAAETIDQIRITRLLLCGLLIGVLFHFGLSAGWFATLGSYFGVVRSVAVTLLLAACFMVGVARARGILRGPAWAAAALALVLIVLMSISSLFLIGGLTYAIAVALGYIIVKRRIPWVGVAVALTIAAVLHAGKPEMRLKYWDPESNYGQTVTVWDLPRFAFEWIQEGVVAVASPSDGVSLLERASLIHMVLRVETETPSRIDYLNGETYALLPSILLPRFIDADKPATQAGMDLLSIRYGLLTSETVAVTAIGWGLIAEGYANFGYAGVVGIAALLGLFCGALSVWSAQSKVDSLPSLISIASMMALINIEADFISLVSSLLQAFVSVLIFFTIYKWLERPRSEPQWPAEVRRSA
jgi:hypothetical protein